MSYSFSITLPQPSCSWDQTFSHTVSSFLYVTPHLPPTYHYPSDAKLPDECHRLSSFCEGCTAVWEIGQSVPNIDMASTASFSLKTNEPVVFIGSRKVARGSCVKHSEFLETSNPSKSFLHEKC